MYWLRNCFIILYALTHHVRMVVSRLKNWFGCLEERPRQKSGGTVTRVINMLAGRVMHGQGGSRRGKKDEQTLRSAGGVSKHTEMVYKIRVSFFCSKWADHWNELCASAVLILITNIADTIWPKVHCALDNETVTSADWRHQTAAGYHNSARRRRIFLEG